MEKQFEYELSEDDIVDFFEYQTRTVLLRRRRLILKWMLVLTPAIYVMIEAKTVVEHLIFTVMSVILAGVLFLVLFRFAASKHRLRRLCLREIRKYGTAGMTGRQQLRLEAGGLTQHNEFGMLHRTWRGICNIVVTDKHAFVFLSPINILIVPRAAFHDEPEFREVVDVIVQQSQAPLVEANPKARSEKPSSQRDTNR